MEIELIKKLFDDRFGHFDKRLDRLEEYNREALKEFHLYNLKHTELNSEVSSLKEEIKKLPEDRKTLTTLQIVQGIFIRITYMIVPVVITLIIQAYLVKKE